MPEPVFRGLEVAAELTGGVAERRGQIGAASARQADGFPYALAALLGLARELAVFDSRACLAIDAPVAREQLARRRRVFLRQRPSLLRRQQVHHVAVQHIAASLSRERLKYCAAD